MILLEKEFKGLVIKTEFDFDDEHIKLVKDVLKCLEGKTVDVPKGDASSSVVPISILEWFPVVCKNVKFDSSAGSYTKFFNPTILALTLRTLSKACEGPPVDIFVGRIDLSRELRNYSEAFCFALAHEMQHAINALKYAYHALTNWEGFLLNTINVNELLNAKDFEPTMDRLAELDTLQDESPIEEELKLLEKTFGPNIRIWHRDFAKLCEAIKS